MVVNLSTLVNNSFSATGPLDGLSDVVLGGVNPVTAGDVLYYNGTNWINDAEVGITLADYTTKVVTPLDRQSGSTTIVPISVGTTAPSTPNTGDIWVDTN